MRKHCPLDHSRGQSDVASEAQHAGRRGRFGVLGLAVLAGLAHAGPAYALPPCTRLPPPAPPGGRTATDLESHLAQATHFLKRGWLGDAAEELDLARTLPTGQTSAELYGLATDIALASDHHQLAVCWAEEAVRLDPSDPHRAQTLRRLRDEVGLLRVVGPEDGLVTPMQLDPLDPLTSVAERQVVDRVALRWREQTRLPTEATVPIGRYSVNGQEVEVTPDRIAHLALPLNATGAQGLAALQVKRAEASAGVLVVPGSALPNIVPTTQLGLTWPVGVMLVGGLVDVQLPTRYPVLGKDRQGQAPASVTAGARVAADLITALPLSIRPALVVRGGQLAGLGRACSTDGSCGAIGRAGAPEDAAVHTMAWVAMPGAELSIDHRRAGRSGAAGFGLKASGEAIFAWSPSTGTVSVGDNSLGWTTEETAWRGFAVRVMANASFAF